VKKTIIAAAIVFAASTSASWASPCTDALRAFVRIEAQTEIGVSYNDYGRLVGDANLELKMCAASKEGVAHPQAVAGFQKALVLYREALAIWSIKFGTPGWRATSSIDPKRPAYSGIVKRFPAAAKQAKEGGAALSYDSWDAEPSLLVDFVLPFYWNDATGEVKAAGLLL
jgi:hypothetical protein